MGARNYAICPLCVRRAHADHAARIIKAEAQYGVLSATEYSDQRAAIKNVDPEDFQTFAEYYEVYGAADGDVVVDYGGSCTECGLHLTFTDHHPIPEIVETGPAS